MVKYRVNHNQKENFKKMVSTLRYQGPKAQKSRKNQATFSLLIPHPPLNHCIRLRNGWNFFEVVVLTQNPIPGQKNQQKVHKQRLYGCGLDFGLYCHFKGLEAENRKNKATFIPEARKFFTIKVALFFQFDPSKPDFQKSRSLKKPDFRKKDHSHAKKSIITCNSFKWGM